jgi:hypothetical protein
MHYRTQLLCRVSQTLGKGYFTLGNGFAECNTRQRTLGELYIGNGLFAEYFLSGTRQRICRVPFDTRQRICRVPFDTRQRKVTVTAPSDGDGSFAECLLWHSAKRPILPSACYHGPRQRVLQWAPLPVPLLSALATALDKDGFAGSQVSFFGECHGQHSAKMALPIPRFPSLPSVTLGKVTRMSLFYLFLLFYPNKQKIYIIHITLYINHITE